MDRKMKKTQKIILSIMVLIFLAFIIAPSCFAFDTSSADQMMESKRYKDALKEYKKIINRGVMDYGLYYNAGGAASMLGDNGTAMLYYERARLIYDGKASLDRNIRIIKSRTGSDRFDFDVHPLAKLFLFFYFHLSRSDIVLCLLIFIAFLIIFVNIGLWLRWFKTFWFKFISICCIVIIIVAGVSLFIKTRRATNNRRAIVTLKDASLRAQPGEDSRSIMVFPQATEVHIIEKNNEFYRLVLPNGVSGWIKKGDFEFIVPQK